MYQKDLNPVLNSLEQLEGTFLWISVITNRLEVVNGLLHSESSSQNSNHQRMVFLTGKLNLTVVLSYTRMDDVERQLPIASQQFLWKTTV